MCQSHKVLPEILKCDAQICAMELAFFHTESLPAMKKDPIPRPQAFGLRGRILCSAWARAHTTPTWVLFGAERVPKCVKCPQSPTHFIQKG